MSLEFTSKEPNPKVAALVIEVNETSIRDYLELSNRLPILVLFINGGEQSGLELRSRLTEMTNQAKGKILTLVIDAAVSPELTKAFEVQALPTLYALLKGQPAPLFSGAIPLEQLSEVISRVLEVAGQNGLTGSVEIGPTEPELPESHRLAFEAIDKGDYKEALRLYERALAENPSDSLAEAGLAQVNLLIRLENKDLEAILGSAQNSNIFDLADAYVATGQAEKGFEVLLQAFSSTPKTERDAIRVRLLELFLTVGSDNNSVIEARKKLSVLLF